jgi:hypothetical protein
MLNSYVYEFMWIYLWSDHSNFLLLYLSVHDPIPNILFLWLSNVFSYLEELLRASLLILINDLFPNFLGFS